MNYDPFLKKNQEDNQFRVAEADISENKNNAFAEVNYKEKKASFKWKSYAEE